MSKLSIRKEIKVILQDIAPDILKQKSEAIEQQLINTSYWQEADILLAYISIEMEVDTTQILKTAFTQGKMVYIPRINGADLCFHYLFNQNIQLVPNIYNIPEPSPILPVLDLPKLKRSKILVIVPGAAFDRQKNRLGRGKGFYDRFLMGLRKYRKENCWVVGICFSEQLLNQVPVNKEDIPVDIVITDQNIFHKAS